MSTNLDGPEWAEGFRAGKAGDDETPPADIKNPLAWSCGYREGVAVQRFHISLLTMEIMKMVEEPD